MIWIRVFVVLFGVAIGAVIPLAPAGAAKIKSSTDRFNGVIQLTAPCKQRFFGGSYQLRARVNPKTGAAEYVVFVRNEFFESNRGSSFGAPQGGPNRAAYRHFYLAVDPDDREFEVLEGAQSFEGCNTSFCYYEEDFAVELPEDYLAVFAATNMKLRAISRARIAFDMEIPADHVASLLAQVAAVRAATGR